MSETKGGMGATIGGWFGKSITNVIVTNSFLLVGGGAWVAAKQVGEGMFQSMLIAAVPMCFVGFGLALYFNHRLAELAKAKGDERAADEKVVKDLGDRVGSMYQNLDLDIRNQRVYIDDRYRELQMLIQVLGLANEQKLAALSQQPGVFMATHEHKQQMLMNAVHVERKEMEKFLMNEYPSLSVETIRLRLDVIYGQDMVPA